VAKTRQSDTTVSDSSEGWSLRDHLGDREAGQTTETRSRRRRQTPVVDQSRNKRGWRQLTGNWLNTVRISYENPKNLMSCTTSYYRRGLDPHMRKPLHHRIDMLNWSENRARKAAMERTVIGTWVGTVALAAGGAALSYWGLPWKSASRRLHSQLMRILAFLVCTMKYDEIRDSWHSLLASSYVNTDVHASLDHVQPISSSCCVSLHHLGSIHYWKFSVAPFEPVNETHQTHQAGS